MNDPARGLPLLSAAADILGVMPDNNNTPAAPVLANMTEMRQPVHNENKQDKAARAESARPIKQEFNSKIEAVTTPVYLDGEMIGEFITRFFEHQDMRSGAPALA